MDKSIRFPKQLVGNDLKEDKKIMKGVMNIYSKRIKKAESYLELAFIIQHLVEKFGGGGVDDIIKPGIAKFFRDAKNIPEKIVGPFPWPPPPV